MKTLLIAGCGDLGTSLGRQLAGPDYRVIGLRRNADRIPAPITPISADLTRPDTLRALPEGINQVCYIATPGAFEDEAYRMAYVEGLKNLLDALQQQPHLPDRLIFVSSTSVYGISDGSWVDETTPTEPAGFSGRRLLEAEQLLANSGIAGTIVRFGGIYGPGRERLIRKVQQGDPVVAEPPQWTNRIHRDDAVGVLRHLLALPEPAPVYLGVDDEPAPMHLVTDWLAERLGLLPCPRRSGSAGGIRGSNKRCNNKLLVSSGFSFRYPDFRQGYEAMLRAREQAQAQQQ
ncbi:MAG: SDR family oxidoreductase [Ectothiorhodospiraceae bacterium]|nr:SDR family oxidoreductase [Ectothiorhodospiraceae bacterium]MCH8504361.1 SDR family oxidoreductase [Ectothiorhodospiraceae bacterium]